MGLDTLEGMPIIPAAIFIAIFCFFIVAWFYFIDKK
jgi:hypothetical protein